jgi:hypothetical protein
VVLPEGGFGVVCPPEVPCRGAGEDQELRRLRRRVEGVTLECTPKMRQAIKGPATLNGGEQCWCPDKNIPVN